METLRFDPKAAHLQEKIYEKVAMNEALPEELICEIFSWLSRLSLAKCSLVCKKWSRIRPHFFHSNERQDIKFLAEKHFLSLAQASYYAPLSHFIDDCFRKIGETARIRKNPKKINEYAISWDFGENSSYYEMPRPFIIYGEWTFQIYNQTNIKIHSVGIRWIYQSEQGICHLKADEEFLYAFRKDGSILEIDYKKGTLVREIHTKLKRLHGTFSFNKAYVSVNNGWIARYLDHPANAIEYFPIKHPEDAKIIENIENNLCEMKIMEGRILLEFYHKIQVLEMAKGVEELSFSLNRRFEFQGNLTGMTIHHNTLYYFLNGHLEMINLKDHAVRSLIPHINLNWRYLPDREAVIPIFGDLMLFYLHGKMLILNLLERQVVAEIDCFENDFKVYSREQLLTRLMTAIRQHKESISPMEAADQLKMNRIACNII